ncbi:hypothetical protein, variant 2 [Puccinia striiformis f. sp. tritici PST-78]|uniref:Uncharacterized protein n=1 Tax=Puccinia striiformis f. sp. tritici PST-78 TaxID=1165861 RepID=A0A0L0URT2_9BASI|nr:hypothetical protein, variant 2 [Puccinia striiformis f. sp. tritici PST-78]
MVNSKTRRRINYSSSSPPLPTTPSSPSQRLATGVQVTPNKLSRALNNLLTEENAMPRPSPQKQVIMDQLIQTLQTLRARQQQQQQQQQQQSDDEQRQSKRIKIEAAPDGSASLVVSSVHPSQLHPSYYYYHQQQQQRHQNYPTTVAPTSLFSSPSSTSSFNPLQSCSNNQDSPLVSATTQEYGRVIMKKDALINKLGLEAAHRAIRKASSKRKPYHLDHLLSSSASPPSSPQTDCWRTGTIAKWLESPDDDDDDEDEEDDNSLPRSRGLMDSLAKLAQENKGGITSVQVSRSTDDPQDRFWSPVRNNQNENKPTNKRRYDQQAIKKSTQERMSKVIEKKPINVTINQRGTTPPNQQSFFRTEEINQRGRIERYGSYSQLSFSGQQQPHIHGSSGLSSGGSTLHKMIKPGCNLNQISLLINPSPYTKDENRKTPSSSSSSISNPQNSPHNETKNRFPNLTTPYGVLEHRWLTDVDFNRLHSSSSSPVHPISTTDDLDPSPLFTFGLDISSSSSFENHLIDSDSLPPQYSIDPFDDFLHQLS